MNQLLGIIDVTHKFTSWRMGHRVEYIQEFCGCLKALKPGEFNDFILDVYCLLSVEMETLHRVDKHLPYGHEQTFVHDLKVEQRFGKLYCDNAVCVKIRLPYMWYVRSYHDKVQV